ncbi:transglutaminase domain-containing protein [Candidatus Woesearchaeota archaeon]|nr:transglutaminase domain-containing protein [Candidatus Woesearchaeota archaeon]
MATAEEIRVWLEWAIGKKLVVLPLIRKGDYVQKGSDYWIFVDDVAGVLVPFRRAGGLNIKAIRAHFTKRLTKGRQNEYYDRNGTPYKSGVAVALSALVRDRVGECTEMSVIAQLLAQELGRESYWVSGFLRTQNEVVDTFHAWNVVFKGDKFWIFDSAQNSILELKGVQNNEGFVELVTDSETLKYALN